MLESVFEVNIFIKVTRLMKNSAGRCGQTGVRDDSPQMHLLAV